LNLSLVIKFFLFNHQKTVLSALLLSISVITVTSTVLLVGVLSDEINRFAVYPNNLNNDEIIVQSTNTGFTNQELNELYELCEKNEFHCYPFDIREITVALPNQNYTIPLHITELELYNSNFYKYNQSLLLNQIIFNILDLQAINASEPIMIYINTYTTKVMKSDLIISNQINYFGIVIDKHYVFDNTFKFQSFMIIGSEDKISGALPSIKLLPFLEVENSNSLDLFISISANNIVQLLYYLYLVIALITIFSISIIIKNLIDESENEIRIFQIIGYSDFQVILIFLGQALIIGVLGAFLGIFISYFSLNLLFSTMSFFEVVKHLIPRVPPIIILQRLLESIMITTIAAILPLYRLSRRL
jgi:ABC-type antimicrobial peptide transport system permease subunit